MSAPEILMRSNTADLGDATAEPQCCVFAARAHPLQRLYRLFDDRACVMFARSTDTGTPELLRLCPLFADRTQEGHKHTGLGRTW